MTPTGLAVAIVSLARHIQGKDPSLAAFLKSSKQSASLAGVSDDDLAFMDTVINSVSPPLQTSMEAVIAQRPQQTPSRASR